MLIFKIIKLIQSDGGNWPFEVQQPAWSMQGATSNKMLIILEDKVKIFTLGSFHHGKIFVFWKVVGKP
ncbi:hypothetical protein SRABI134_00439 [Peribacillus sp. Bi134]|jgi:hypothetical protein|nr:hypothetical protein SRABI134_00439 [Peribacillus sp. Bi134]